MKYRLNPREMIGNGITLVGKAGVRNKSKGDSKTSNIGFQQRKRWVPNVPEATWAVKCTGAGPKLEKKASGRLT